MTTQRSEHRAPVSLRNLFPDSVIIGAGDILAGSCRSEARQCQSGDVFVANSQIADDITRDTDLAIANGAAAVITEELLPIRVPQLVVDDVRIAHGQLCYELANRPCEELLTVGVLGTHGKTTVSLLAATMMKKICGGAAYHTSLGASDGVRHDVAMRSDATAEDLTKWLSNAVEQGTPTAVLEATRNMLVQRTTSGLQFDVLIVPSFRRAQRGSELENNGLEAAILRTMGQLKDHGILIYNADDARLNRWVKRNKLPALSYGLDAEAEVQGQRLQRQSGEQTLLVSAGRCMMPLTSQLVGDHNARHLLAAAATGYAFGLELFEVIGSIERLTRIPGRMQSIQCGQPFTVHVDAADQPDRLAVALHALAATGPVTCVAEVPDNSTSQWRSDFGRVLERSARHVILTQSRLSGRAGQTALWEVLDGCERPAAVSVIPNRATAIEFAMRNARAGDQVLLAGWGANHWTSGNERGVKNDQATAEAALRSLDEPARAKPQPKSEPTSLKIFQPE